MPPPKKIDLLHLTRKESYHFINSSRSFLCLSYSSRKLQPYLFILIVSNFIWMLAIFLFLLCHLHFNYKSRQWQRRTNSVPRRGKKNLAISPPDFLFNWMEKNMLLKFLWKKRMLYNYVGIEYCDLLHSVRLKMLIRTRLRNVWEGARLYCPISFLMFCVKWFLMGKPWGFFSKIRHTRSR